MTWMWIYYISVILIVPTLIYGLITQNRTIKTFELFSKNTTKSNLAGAELARLLLDKAGATNVEVVQINGHLTDCYNSKHKVVKLSKATYSSVSIAALGVVAHEVGHAIQDHKNMTLFKIREFLVPVVNFISRAYVPLILIGSLLSFTFYIPTVGFAICWASVALYGASLLFNFATLGIEKDASKKALDLMAETDYFSNEELRHAKQVLQAAIGTYIATFTTSLVYFLRFLSVAMILNRDS